MPAAVVASPTASSVPDLIAQHQRAFDATNAAWNDLSDLQMELEEKIGTPKIHMGNLLLGRDSEGNDIRKPIYGYSEEDILRHAAYHIEHALNDEVRRQKEKHRDAMLAELRAAKARQKDAEDACGITAAFATCKKLNDEQNRLMRELIKAKPATLAEAAAKATHLHDVFQTEAADFDDGLLLAVIKSLV
ncbi:hypothetical protein [Allorhizobium borbori]|uniref:Uncharacterized protein n=1 Tax=Allorhizobium borbori TaxID=485907 RepID=A0A7W6K3F7_9HYPH|nr:hypothetical protein [Allorhizobium borbori]MBB4103546.1 hypothetical protein [Allorhizobium borbori]